MEYLVHFIIKKNLVSVTKLLQMRTLSRQMGVSIENESFDVKRLLKFYKEITQKLCYDSKVYDQYYYRRLVIQNNILQIFQKYKEITIPSISSCYTDLDDNDDDFQEKMYFVNEEPIPIEFNIFLHEYKKSPSVHVRPYPPELIQQIILKQRENIRRFLINMGEKLDLHGISYLVPLCYSKHYPSHYRDGQYINVLCYINLIDKELEPEFPEPCERYITFIVEMDDLDNVNNHYLAIKKFLNKISRSVSTSDSASKVNEYYYPQDLARSAQSFEKCFDILIQNQNFNL